jgi:DNA repair exonuclease SbcCD nuclease subunit
MSVKFIHTADWQIGKGLNHIPGDEGAVLRDQRFKTLDNIAKIATKNDVDAVLVAGDIFDAHTIEDKTIRRTFEKLRSFPGLWVMLPGNHDAALSVSVWTRAKELMAIPDNVTVALRPEPILIDSSKLAILPAPLQRKHEHDDLTEWFDQVDTPDGYVRVGLAHGSVIDFLPQGQSQHNPIDMNRAAAARLSYLALGDWHGCLKVNNRTWYSGTPETDRFKSNDPGNVLLVGIEGPDAEPVVEKIKVTHFNWHEIDHEIHGPEDIDVLKDRIANLDEPYDSHLIKLTVFGELSLSDKEALDAVVEEWKGRFRYVRFDDSNLGSVPSGDDLAELQTSGYVADAANKLMDRATRGEDDALIALQMLFSQYRKIKAG